MAGRHHRWFQLGVGTLVAVTAAYLVMIPISAVRHYGAPPWTLLAEWQAGQGYSGFYLLGSLAAVMACVLALVVAVRAPERREGRALAWFAAFLGLFWAASPAFLVTGWPGRVQLATFAAVYASYILTTAALLRLAACFPAQLTPADLTRRTGRRAMAERLAERLAGGAGHAGHTAHTGHTAHAGHTDGADQAGGAGAGDHPVGAGVGAGATAAADDGGSRLRRLALQRMPPEWLGRRLLDGRTVWGLALIVALGVPAAFLTLARGPLPQDLGMLTVFLTMILGLGLGVAAIGYMRIGYALAGPEARRRTLWALAGFTGGLWLVTLVLTMMLIGMLGLWKPPLAPVFDPLSLIMLGLAAVVVMAGLYVAVFASGAVDPALVIRGTMAYGALSVLLTFAFAGLENAGSALLVDRLGWDPSLVGWLAGGTVALMFGGLRKTALAAAGRIEARAGEETAVTAG